MAKRIPFLLLMACQTEAPARLLIRALQAADAGQSSAWGQCLQVPRGRGQGMCLVEASRTQADRAAACDAIADDRWRSECWFVYAEELWAEEDPAAVDACAQAGRYAEDCVAHLWVRAQGSGTATDELRRRLVAAVPGSEARLDPGSGMPLLRYGIPRPPTPAEQPEGDWAHRFRRGEIDRPASCPEVGRVSCVEAGRAAFVEHWGRALEREPGLLDRLCAGGPVPDGLAPRGDPTWEDALAELRRTRCPSGG